MGYHRSGFEVVGVDIAPQPNYPFEFVQADALEYLSGLLHGRAHGDWDGSEYGLGDFDAIHASPPCQAHSTIAKQVRKLGRTANEHPDLVPQTRELLQAMQLPYVIENVVGAPLINPTLLCGSSFGLDVRRHRLFETNWPLLAPPCAHGWQTPRFRSLDSRRAKSVVPIHGSSQLASVVGVHGNLNYRGEMELRKRAMEICWMSNYELTQAIPPAYTELIGHQLLTYLNAQVAA